VGQQWVDRKQSLTLKVGEIAIDLFAFLTTNPTSWIRPFYRCSAKDGAHERDPWISPEWSTRHFDPWHHLLRYRTQ